MGEGADVRPGAGRVIAKSGAAGKNRTCDPALTKGVLCP